MLSASVIPVLVDGLNSESALMRSVCGGTILERVKTCLSPEFVDGAASNRGVAYPLSQPMESIVKASSGKGDAELVVLKALKPNERRESYSACSPTNSRDLPIGLVRLCLSASCCSDVLIDSPSARIGWGRKTMENIIYRLTDKAIRRM